MRSLLACSFLCTLLHVYAQENNIPTNTWRFHNPAGLIQQLTESPQYLYATSELNFFRVSKSDMRLQMLDKTNGFSDVGITSAAFDSKTGKVVIGYETGGFDIVDESDRITVVSSIRNSNTIAGSKRINSVFCYNGIAYLSTDFGLLEYNLERDFIINLYQRLGSQGSSTGVLDCIINPANDTIVLATRQGLIASSIRRTVNRLDFNQWFRFGTPQQSPVGEVQKLVLHDGLIHAAQNGIGVFRLGTSGNWSRLNTFSLVGAISQIRSVQGRLFVMQSTGMLEFSSNGTIDTVRLSALNNPVDIVATQGGFFVASNFSGLFRLNSNFELISNLNPNSTIIARPFHLYSFENSVAFLSGGYTGVLGAPVGNQLGVALFDNRFWTGITSLFGNTINSEGQVENMRDVVRAYYHPTNKNIYIACYGFGIFRFEENFGKVTRYDSRNSRIVSTFRKSNPLYSTFFRMCNVVGDENGDLWAYNYVFSGDTLNDNFLHQFKLKANGELDSARSLRYTLPENIRSVDIVIDAFGNKWMTQQGENLVVFKETSTTEYQLRVLSDATNQGALPTRRIRCLARDLNDDIWIGTADGVAVIFGSSNVMRGNVNASRPVFDRRPLLNDQSIASIAVDGGNRKWIGTSSGVYLFNPDGTSLIRRFTKDNSPLPSDNVLQIVINQRSGEVFFNTDRGVVSYRSDATESKTDNPCDQIKVFPNPVRSSLGDDLVTITGIQSNALVKITDLSGKLIAETLANGGTATWNCRDYNGEKAHAGVYIIWTGPEEGKGCANKKIAIVD
jgi:ligand-binding sensor domain-containing protein